MSQVIHLQIKLSQVKHLSESHETFIWVTWLTKLSNWVCPYIDTPWHFSESIDSSLTSHMTQTGMFVSHLTQRWWVTWLKLECLQVSTSLLCACWEHSCLMKKLNRMISIMNQFTQWMLWRLTCIPIKLRMHHINVKISLWYKFELSLQVQCIYFGIIVNIKR